MKNKKGFTLVELLAVIVILGILLLIAVPAVQNIIKSSRKKAFISTCKLAAEYVENLVSIDGPPPYPCFLRMINSENEVKLERGDFGEILGAVAVNTDGKVYIYAYDGATDTCIAGKSIENMSASDFVLSSGNCGAVFGANNETRVLHANKGDINGPLKYSPTMYQCSDKYGLYK